MDIFTVEEEQHNESNEIRYLVAMEELSQLSQTRRVCLCALSYWIQQKKKGRNVDVFIQTLRRQLREIRNIDISMCDINLMEIDLKK